MMFNLKIVFLLVITISIINVNVCFGRTCVCAAFLDTECNGKDQCTWNYAVPTSGTVKGVHGICRSTKWFTCHTDAECKARLMKVKDYDAVSDWPTESQKGNKDKDDQTNGEGVSHDWPWDCQTGDYSEDLINVQEYDEASYDIQSILLDNSNHHETIKSNMTLSKSIGTLPMMTTIIVFIAALCGLIIHFSYKRFNKSKSLNDDSTPSYSTFNQI